jgi:hypothetical protein
VFECHLTLDDSVSPAIPNAIAAPLLHIRDMTSEIRWSASRPPPLAWQSGELRGLAGAPEAAGERQRLG